MSRIEGFSGFLFGFGFLWADLSGMGLLNKIFDGEGNVILFMAGETHLNYLDKILY
jgi:hypothetical protein